MTALTARWRPRVYVPSGVRRRQQILVGCVGIWSVALLAAALVGASDAQLEFQPFGPSLALNLAVAGPLAALGYRVLSEAEPTRVVRGLTVWTVLLGLSYISALIIAYSPVAALAIPTFAIAAVVCSRRPAGTVIFGLVLSGSVGTLQAYTGFKSGILGDLAFGGLWAGLIWSIVTRRRTARFNIWPGVAVATAYLTLTAMQILLAHGVYVGLRSFRLSGWLMMVMLLIGYSGWPRRTYIRIAHGALVVGLLVGAYAVFRWIVGPSADEATLANQLVGPFNYVDGKFTVIGSFSSRHQMGAWAATFIPFALACAFGFSGIWRLLSIAGAGACAIGLLGANVRIAAAGVVVAIAVVIILIQVSRGFPGLRLGIASFAVIAAALAGVALFAVVLDGPQDKQRYENILTPGKDASVQGRFQKWSTGVASINDHPWGQGLGTSGIIQKTLARFTNASTIDLESVYLKVAFEQGWAMMGLYILSLVLLLFGLARRAVLTTDPLKATLGIGAAGSLLAFMILAIAAVYNEGLVALGIWVYAGLGVAMFATDGDAAPGSAPQA